MKAKSIFMVDETGRGVRGCDHKQFVCPDWAKRLGAVRVNCWYVLEVTDDQLYLSSMAWHHVKFRKNFGRIEMWQNVGWRSVYPPLSDWLLEHFDAWKNDEPISFSVIVHDLKGTVP